MVKLILRLILDFLIVFIGLPCVVYARVFPETYATPSWWSVVVVIINIFWLIFLAYIVWLII